MKHAWKILALFALASVRPATAAVTPTAATPASTETGRLQGASFRIDVPANWNHRLVVFFHGYTDAPVVFQRDEPIAPMLQPMLHDGYAVIQSGYSGGGWVLRQAAAETEALRLRFIAHYGKPTQTLVMGMSMGGALTAMTIENHPERYAGALSLCGAIESSDRLVQHHFALRAAFDHYFPGLLGPLVPVPASYRADAATTAKIAAALRNDPKARDALLRWYGAADANNLPGVIAFIGAEARSLQQRAGGNPVGNANFVYVGSGDDAALNDGVHRYRADPAAAKWLARWYTPSGKLLRPMLDLHDTGDPLVPASGTIDFALAAERAGHGNYFVQQFVHHEGHCVFTPNQIATAFHELTRWVDTGKRPAAGRLP